MDRLRCRTSYVLSVPLPLLSQGDRPCDTVRQIRRCNMDKRSAHGINRWIHTGGLVNLMA